MAARMATNDTDQAIGHSTPLEHWSWYLSLSTGLLLFAIYATRLGWGSKLRRLPLPPGPKGLPILGNMLQVASTKTKSWFMYADWAKQYSPNGDMVYLEVLGQPILVLGSLKAIGDLLEKRGSTYADRSVPPAMQMMKIDWSLAIMDYGPSWRAHRRMFHQYYNKTQIYKYAPVLEYQTNAFLQRLLSTPQEFMDHTRFLFGAIIIQISYGLTSPAEIESLTESAESIVKTFVDCAKPGYFLVDLLPFIRWIPSWLPGAGWKRRLEGVAKTSQKVFRMTFDNAQEQAKQAGTEDAQDVAAQIIANLPPKNAPDYVQQEMLGRGTALVAYVAGADTTVASSHALFGALANYPESQRAAQDELDLVIGSERLPSVADLPQLPYIQALVKELARWFTVAPVAIPHVASQDDTYNGYFIPKGTVVMPNTWAIMHDPDVFDDPLEFKPERYLMRDPDTNQLKINPAVLDPENAAFGYGRRICPGRHLSTEALTLMVASLLTVFNVNAPKDASGRPTKVKLETGAGFLQTPAPFKVYIVPRSVRHAALVSREE